MLGLEKITTFHDQIDCNFSQGQGTDQDPSKSCMYERNVMKVRAAREVS